jgi:serine/threonine protein kinase
MADLIGTRIGKYRLLAKIASGGAAAIYRAQDEELDRPVAIKLLASDHLDDAESKARLIREARLIAASHHPNVAAIYDVGVFGRRPYLAMELVAGRSLREMLQERPLAVLHAVHIGAQIAHALEAVHRAGVLHRDLKPDNIIVGEKLHVKVLDFGLGRWMRGARRRDSRATPLGIVVGSPLYMAPEQVRGRALDARADLFALGVIMFEMVTGRTPYARGRFVDVMHAIVTEPAPELRSVCAEAPALLEAIVKRLLEKNAAARFDDAGDVATLLEWTGKCLVDGVPFPMIEDLTLAGPAWAQAQPGSSVSSQGASRPSATLLRKLLGRG